MNATNKMLLLAACLVLRGLAAAQGNGEDNRTLNASQLNLLKNDPKLAIAEEASRTRSVSTPFASSTSESQYTRLPTADVSQRTAAAHRAVDQKKIFDNLTVSNGRSRNLQEVPQPNPSGA